MKLTASDKKHLKTTLRTLRAQLPGPSQPVIGQQGDIADLLASCRDRAAGWVQPEEPPIRCIHHLACTGGTLIAQCIAAQPNVQLLSEVDPLSPFSSPEPFAPTDMIKLAKFAFRPSDDDIAVEIFLAGLEVLYNHARLSGTALVLRDHSHGQFSQGAEIPDRRTLQEILLERYQLRSIVSVRHPADSYLSLQRNDWAHFTPANFEEYCRRYLVFLERYAGISVLRYEDFVADPARHTRWLCDLLELSYNPGFEDRRNAIPLSGNSGRSGPVIEPRPRRQMSTAFIAEAAQSASYHALCRKLGYAPKLDAPPVH